MKKWSDEEKEIVYLSKEQNLSLKDIAKELECNGYGRTVEAIKKMLRRDKLQVMTKGIEEKETSEEYKEVFNQIQKLKKETLSFVSKKFNRVGKIDKEEHRIISISDMHTPFENQDVLCHVIENSNYNDTLVVVGDFIDNYSVSRWPKQKQFLLQHEYQIAFEYLKLFSQLYKKVILVKGNHDDRVSRYFSSTIDPAISFLVHPDVLERMTNGYSFTETGEFKKVEDFKNIIYQPGPCSWYAKIGKVIFAHPHGGGSNKVAVKLPVSTFNYFLDKEDFQCLVLGHSHKQSKTIWKNKLLIEQGCLCIPMDYEANAKMVFGTQSFGYSTIILDKDGNVDFNKSNYFYYGTATMVTNENLLNRINK